MKQVTIDKLADYLQLIKENKEENLRRGNGIDFVFRGQLADYPLMPKLCRLKAKGDILETERVLLQEFKRSNPLLIDQPRPMDDWDYLTLGQHFGLPTRFLDWSINALTALWFATSSQTGEEEEYSVVWILMPDKEDADLNIEETHPFEVRQTKIVRPRIIKQRINNQSGVFTISSSDEIQQKRSMNESENFERKLIKVKIAACRFPEIRDDLNTLGVNAFSIYPELEGLCSFLQWRYFD
jgi:hypothetical protein